MSWQKEVDELRRRQALAQQMGGADKLEKQRSRGKLNVRQRIEALLDPLSFHELGSIAGKSTYDADGELVDFTPSNLLFGRGRIEGRPVVVGGDDFTVRGGAADAAIWSKLVMAEQMAWQLRLPLVRLVDGTGGGGSVKSLDEPGACTYVPEVPGMQHMLTNLQTVPVVGLALGPTAGMGAARVVMSHYSMMVRGLSQMFVAGPPVVRHLGEDVDKETLGGSALHTRNGVVDDEVETEAEAFERAARFLSYLPDSVHELGERVDTGDDSERAEEWLIEAIPRDTRRGYKVRPILEAVLDHDSFFEMGKLWGRSAITGLARLDGWPVAVLANDPQHHGGGWTADASMKITRFIDLAETFHLPVVHFVDNPGFVIGTTAERTATVRHGARALAAIHQAQVPFCCVLLRKCFGIAGASHMNQSKLRYRYAWPSGDWGSLPIEGGIEAAYRGELEASQDPAAELARIKARLNAVRSPFRSADAFMVEEIIDPRETRARLTEFAGLSAKLRTAGPSAVPYRP